MKNQRKFIIILLILCALVVAGCQSPFVPAKTELGQERVVVPMRLNKNIPLVEIFINGQGPYTFFLDTGTGAMVIPRELADRLSLPEVTAMSGALKTGSGKEVTIQRLVHINSLRIGTAEFSQFKAAVIDFEGYPELLEECDGILGFPLFAECLLTMDFSGGKIIPFLFSSQVTGKLF